ncbi:MAG: DNA ligase [Candidatus Diapherotrites archaeon]|uniref:DNA ligase n=1 Tax=Candidatus Iainarchaeum sp. TaxID=3101447 RepID=A0A2D6M1R8_9ARCH|nr:DNA ligase [Candidatus Diapherotrites archaeon]|tara:strand:+ start:2135 stop:3979 length:1845 start_codon:yes stop_codon:yes gene_type:complete
MHFRKLSEYFDKIENVSSRLEMTSILAELFKETPGEEIARVIYFSQGQLAPPYKSIEIGMGEKFVEDAIAKGSGYTKKEVHEKFKQIGDLGNVAEEFLKKKKQESLFSTELTIGKIFENLLKIAKTSGSGSQGLKTKLLAELLNNASPVEARYIVRIPLGKLRLGVGDPTIMDAFAINLSEEAKSNKKLVAEVEKQLKEKNEEKRKQELDRKIRVRVREIIEDKYNIHSDLGVIAETLITKGLKGLEKIHIKPGIPIRPTLAERLPSSKEIIKKLGKCGVEAKYDGFRLAVHKNEKEVTIFSRRQENVTEMFPELIEAVRTQIKAKGAIFEGEALAFNEETKEYYPFQITIQRKRKYGIKEMAEEFPLTLFCFDLLYVDGENLMPLPFKERREKLKSIIGRGKRIALTDSIVTDDPKKVDEYFNENIESGLEGIIAKDLNAPYIAGARKFSWIKLKRSYKGELSDTVDTVIIGFFKGKGHRTQFGLGALLTAVYDEKDGMFRSIAKIGTGMKEDDLKELHKILSKISEDNKPKNVDSEIKPDFWVSPKYVVEAIADEITKSPIHTAGRGKGKEGFALRFPRMVKLRQDKTPEQATTVLEIEKMFKNQKNVKLSE